MSGQLVDASIVSAPKQRTTRAEKQAIKYSRIPEEWRAKPAKLRQKDREARWTVKATKAKPRRRGASCSPSAGPTSGATSTRSPRAATRRSPRKRWRIGALFGIERTIRGQSREQRRAVRLAQTTPRIDDLRAWLEALRAKVSGGSRIARTIHYALKHWAGLTVFINDGRVEIDSIVVERAIRPIALNRKNAFIRRLRPGRLPLRRDRLADRDRKAQRGRSSGPMSPMSLAAWSTATLPAGSTSSCLGSTPKPTTWPDNGAYQSPAERSVCLRHWPAYPGYEQSRT
jgi:hypothetical protein